MSGIFMPCIKGNPVQIRNSARYCKYTFSKWQAYKSLSHNTIMVADGKTPFRCKVRKPAFSIKTKSLSRDQDR